MSGRAEELFDLLDGGGVVLGDGAMGTLLQDAGTRAGRRSRALERRARLIPMRRDPHRVRRGRRPTWSPPTRSAARARAWRCTASSDRVRRAERAPAPDRPRASRTGSTAGAGDVGPTGETCLRRSALVEPDETRALFEEQIRGLVDGGADVMLIETMSDSRGGRGRRPCRARRSPRSPDRRHAELRHQPPHDDGREPGAGRPRRSPRSGVASSAPTAAAAPTRSSRS